MRLRLDFLFSRKIRFKKLIPEATAPYKPIMWDAGFDFYCTSIERFPDKIVCHTGIAVEIPKGMVGLAFPRSSVVNKDLILKNCVGVIDSTFRGEIVFFFLDTKKYLTRDLLKKQQYEVGDRIGQMVFLDLPNIKLIESNELSETIRGAGGFGHTGK